MATLTVEERLSLVEKQLAELLAELLAEKAKTNTEPPWYEQMAGAFENDEIFDRAMEAGAAYRRSQPTAAEEIEALEKAGIHVPLPPGH